MASAHCLTPGALRDNLIQQHLPQVHRLARQMYHRLRYQIEMDDLISLGKIGLLEAIDHFKPGRGATLSTFAESRIFGAMMDGVRNNSPYTRSDLAAVRAIDQATTALEHTLGRHPSQEELSNELGWSIAQLHTALTYGARRTYYLEDIIPQGHRQSLDFDSRKAPFQRFQPLSRYPSPQSQLLRAEEKSIVARAIDNLADTREKRVLNLSYIEGRPNQDIAAELQLSPCWVSRIRKNALAKIRDYLTHEWGSNPPSQP